ncbi:MAG: precorrin-3B C(17)-methyltransferase [Acidimicrobiales bacterium]
MKVLTVSVTEAGRALASRLPYERTHGELAATVRGRWNEVDAFVVIIAVGAAVRIIAPLLSDKATDPGVVCVDDAGRHVVAVLGGHAGSANALALEVAATLGAEPVITTATDSTSTVALDQLPGLSASGDIAGVTAAMLNGARPALDRRIEWALPEVLLAATLASGGGGEVGGGDQRDLPRIILSDEVVAALPMTVTLCPGSLVAGIGTSTDAPPDEVADLLQTTLAAAGLNRAAVTEVATIDRRRTHPAVEGIGLRVTSYAAPVLAAVRVPTPSSTVNDAVGTPSVAEAAALLAAGPGSTLVVTKRTSPHATAAIARRAHPPGKIALVGLGPGGPGLRAPDATAALRNADTVIGFHPYLEQCADALGSSQDVCGSPIGDEVGRARLAVERARQGRSVAVVCSGDSGVYAMASLVFEEAGDAPGFALEVIPGITAALAAAARLGAPLGHDHLVLSLSDLLTPWDLIRSRVEAAREADLVIALYNPRSKQRNWQLQRVCELLLTSRPGSTPVGVVTDVGRPGEQITLTTLAELDPELVGMTTCVIIGSSTTRVIGGRMVTPRGYRREAPG